MRSLNTRLVSIRHRRIRRLVLTLLVDTWWAVALLLLAGLLLVGLVQFRGA